MSNFGNNMFQWAVAYAVSKKRGFELYNSDWSGASNDSTPSGNGLEIFNLPPKTQTPNVIHHCFRDSGCAEQTFNPEIFNVADNTVLEGYFQTDKYFIDCRDDILNFFSFKDKTIDEKANDFIKSFDKKVVICAHSREGDYVLGDGFPIPSAWYFKRAVDKILEINNLNKEDVGIAFISDNKNSDRLKILIDENFDVKISPFGVENKLLDLSIMKNAHHCITAASSFSWWGAWLNRNSPTIISPMYWFNYHKNTTVWSPRDIAMSIPNQYFIAHE
jgi:hypothetical protein